MNYYELILGDEDIHYSTNLIEYINSDKEQLIRARGFSNQEMLNHYVQNNPIDILLITPSMYKDTFKNADIKAIIILAEGKMKKELEKIPIINKYQNIDNILKKIIDLYAEVNEEKLFTSNRTTKLIGIYSPIGRCGKTSISIRLCGLLSKKTKVLCINMEPFNSLSQDKNSDIQYTFSDLLYYARQKHPNIILKLESIIEKINGMDYIYPVRYYQDLNEIQKEELVGLFQILKEETKYDYIIINFSSHLYDYTLELLKQCHTNIFIKIPDPFGKMQMNNWEDTLKSIREEEILEQSLTIMNHIQVYDGHKNFLDESIIQLPYDSQLKTHLLIEEEIPLDNNLLKIIERL
ncbi:AAA domain-containing protein [Natranaerovirga hydrolytica]|uniref:AAA domain-containing protein n=1 Tax=Natranaerovirga hydrolytica TaxID=680378 RepID=A0A4R1N940_9FIRM|nr:AAA family ATPase [Natranaerovirga hydrolytica]TCL00081.1 AAA domain-containing protein [Natranaerovirga hydrolytica]